MFGLGVGEAIIIASVGVLLFGAKKLPQLGGAMGKAIKDFKKGLADDEDKNNPQITENPSSSDDQNERPS